MVDSETFFARVTLAGRMVLVSADTSDLPAINPDFDAAVCGTENACGLVPLLCWICFLCG